MIPFLCAKIGGIWCYWPNVDLGKAAIITALILVIFWILLNKRNKHKNHAGKKSQK